MIFEGARKAPSEELTSELGTLPSPSPKAGPVLNPPVGAPPTAAPSTTLLLSRTGWC